jgi:sucrose-6-phosphate hydrolase SacC (GH32 family)
MKKLTLILALTLAVSSLVTACGSDNPEKIISSEEINMITEPDVMITEPPSYDEPSYSLDELVEGNDLYTELWRPQYHFTAQNTWLNDPNGLVYFGGKWHMYYQNRRERSGAGFTGAEHWGHAVSDDLVNWEEVEPALYPDGSGSMWSGTAYADTDNRSGLFNGVDGGGIIAAYSTNNQTVGIAYSTDGYTFKKLGIVIGNHGYGDFRDPKIFWNEVKSAWTMVVAGGKVRFFESKDLLQWKLVSENEIYTECPDFFKMKVAETGEEKWVLTCAGRGYYVGSYDGTVFTPETGCIPLERGPDAYAGITFSCVPDGRIIMVNWMNDWSYSLPADGIWCSALTLASELTLHKGKNYYISQAPAEEYKSVEGKALLRYNGVTEVGKDNLLKGLKSQSFVLRARIDLENTTDFTLLVCVGEDEYTKLTFNKNNLRFVFDRTQTVYGTEAFKNIEIPYNFSLDKSLVTDNIIDIEIYVDRSSVEIYAGGGTRVFRARIQPFTSSNEMSLTSKKNATFTFLEIKEMNSIHHESEDEVEAIHVPTETVRLVVGGEFKLRVSPYNYGRQVFVQSGDESVFAATLDGSTLTLKGVSEGESYVRVRSGKHYVDIRVIVYKENVLASDIGSFTVTDGTIKAQPNGYLLTAYGWDAFAISDREAGSFIYEADISNEQGIGTAALIFRAKDVSNLYCLCLDYNSNVVKLWGKKDGNAFTVKTAAVTLEADTVYRLGVSAQGNTFAVTLDGVELFTVVDNNHTSGKLGFNTYTSAAIFNNVTVR